MKRSLIVVAGMLSVLALPFIATAHNAGHVFLPDGSCQEMGSFRPGPLVGKDRIQLDLVPETVNPPRDEYGVSFVGYHANTPILPGACPAEDASVAPATEAPGGIPNFAVISYQ